MSVSLSTSMITSIHFAFLFNRKKQHEHILSLLSLFLENKHYKAYYETNSDSCYSCLRS